MKLCSMREQQVEEVRLMLYALFPTNFVFHKKIRVKDFQDQCAGGPQWLMCDV